MRIRGNLSALNGLGAEKCIDGGGNLNSRHGCVDCPSDGKRYTPNGYLAFCADAKKTTPAVAAPVAAEVAVSAPVQTVPAPASSAPALVPVVNVPSSTLPVSQQTDALLPAPQAQEATPEEGFNWTDYWPVGLAAAGLLFALFE